MYKWTPSGHVRLEDQSSRRILRWGRETAPIDIVHSSEYKYELVGVPCGEAAAGPVVGLPLRPNWCSRKSSQAAGNNGSLAFKLRVTGDFQDTNCQLWP